MRFDVITLFASAFDAITLHGITRKALENKAWQLQCWNPRDFTHDKWRTVDDRSYGGGPGMVMMADPLIGAVQAVQQSRVQAGQAQAKVALLSPQGKRLNQALVQELAQRQHTGLVLVCGRYEGIDERFVSQYVDEQYSLGDFVLSGGELAAMALIDAVVRQLPGVLNDEQSAVQDSYSDALSGLLDCPHYTRPEQHTLGAVPAVLLSGHHDNIAWWRRQQSLQRTWQLRPDLIHTARQHKLLSERDEQFLQSLPR